MRRTLRHGVLTVVSVLAVLGSVSVAEPPVRLKVAQDLARAHAAWPKGRDWLTKNRSKAGQLMIPVLNRCLPGPSDDEEVTAFSIYVRLSQKGTSLEVVADISAELGSCMTREAREVQLPEAPREDFWIQLNLAAGL